MIKRLAVILNGPPGCGKDTIANKIVAAEEPYFLGRRKFIKHQFKDALYEHTAKHFQVDVDKFIHYASDRDLKDSISLAGLGGRTPRQALIHVSEDVYKPRHGQDYFGKVEAARVKELAGRMGGTINVIYPDGGFGDEVVAIESAYDFVLIVRLHRDGFDFTGDSRRYINLPDTPTRVTVDEHLVDGKVGDSVFKVFNWIERVTYQVEK